MKEETTFARSAWNPAPRLGRGSNLPTVWTNCLAGTLLAGGGFDVIVFAPAVVATSVFYAAGMLLRDAFGRGFDSEYRPEGTTSRADAAPRQGLVTGFGLMAVGVLLLHLPSWFLGGRIHGEVVFWSLLLALLIVYDSYRIRPHPLSPLVPVLCRAMVYLVAAALASSAFQAPVLVGAALPSAYLIGVVYGAKQETNRTRDSWPLLFLAVPFIYHAQELPSLSFAGLVWAAFLCWVLFTLGFFYRKRAGNMPRTVIGLIAGISLLDALAIASMGGEPGVVAAAVACFLLVLAFQRYFPGVHGT